MQPYDWIVVGNGLAGAALSYELAKVGCSVLLLDQAVHPQNATRFSYGGIAYWSGNTDLTRHLCTDGIALHRQLSAELESDTQFRELDLLLTIPPDRDPEEIAAPYRQFAIPPTLLSPRESCELEPLLHSKAIAGSLRFPHGHVCPVAMVEAYNQAFARLQGVKQIASVIGFAQTGLQVTGVGTATETLTAAHVAVCTGGLTRSLLKQAGLSLPLYFTHAEIIETPPVEVQLRSLIMPAITQRFALEHQAGDPQLDRRWDELDQELAPAILDPGAVQFQDGHLCLGQFSRTLTNPIAPIDAKQSETQIRQSIGQILPGLKELPGEWHRCLVAFSGDRLPLVGAVPQVQGLYLFTSFSSPFCFLPPIARRFAQQVAQPSIEPLDPILAKLHPSRFQLSETA